MSASSLTRVSSRKDEFLVANSAAADPTVSPHGCRRRSSRSSADPGLGVANTRLPVRVYLRDSLLLCVLLPLAPSRASRENGGLEDGEGSSRRTSRLCSAVVQSRPAAEISPDEGGESAEAARARAEQRALRANYLGRNPSKTSTGKRNIRGLLSIRSSFLGPRLTSSGMCIFFSFFFNSTSSTIRNEYYCE